MKTVGEAASVVSQKQTSSLPWGLSVSPPQLEPGLPVEAVPTPSETIPLAGEGTMPAHSRVLKV